MRRIFITMMTGLCLTANACSPDNTPVESDAVVPEPESNSESDSDAVSQKNNRYLVVYFSCTNTTKGIADRIAAITGCETYRIEPEEAYTSSDLDYNNSSSRANREQNDDSARPAIADAPESLSGYDGIFLGYPIWWGKAPRIVWLAKQ